MTQTVPATAVLGPGLTGLTIGLRVLNLDGTEYAAFSATGVTETSTAGTYRKAGGVVVPAAGGYIVWGEAATDYAEATVESTAVNVTHHAGVAVAPADANGNVPVDVQTWRAEPPEYLIYGLVKSSTELFSNSARLDLQKITSFSIMSSSGNNLIVSNTDAIGDYLIGAVVAIEYEVPAP